MASDITAGTLAGKNTKVHESLVDDIDSYEDTTPRKVISKKDLFPSADDPELKGKIEGFVIPDFMSLQINGKFDFLKFKALTRAKEIFKFVS